jgi:uncharacterized membrane protein (UPF0136 family)
MSKISNNPQTDIISYAYALTVLAGGLAGYAKAGSIPSLAAGILFSGCAAFGAYQTSNNPVSVHTGMFASGTLLGVMGYRYMMNAKFMPAGLVAILSAGQLVRLGLRLTK